MTSLPSKEDLQKAWEDLVRIHKTHLEKHGVKIPGVVRYHEKQKALWLAVLHHFQGEEVSKDFMSEVAERDMPHLGKDQQVRHLKRDGWKIQGSKPGHHKLDPYAPSSEFLNDDIRRRMKMGAASFDDLKAAYGHKCATCGAPEGEPNPRYGDDEKVVLQQGHQDPHKAGDIAENIIPQCQFCNRAYRDDFVFDDKGRVKAVANIRPVRGASRQVKRHIFEWLKNYFDGS